MTILPLVLLAAALSPQRKTEAFSASLPFTGGTPQMLMKHRGEVSGRASYLIRLGPIGGVGLAYLRDDRGSFSNIDQPGWSVILDQSQPTRIPSKVQAGNGSKQLMTSPIDVFAPKILLKEDFMGVGYSVLKTGPDTHKVGRIPSTTIMNLTGEFKVIDLPNMGFSKPIKFAPVLGPHLFYARTGYVEESELLAAIARAGKYRLEKRENEYELSVDPISLPGLIYDTTQTYFRVDTDTHFGAKLLLRSKAIRSLSPQEIDELCRGKLITKQVGTKDPLRSEILALADRTIKERPEIGSKILRAGEIRMTFEGYAAVGFEIQTQEGKFQYF